MSLPTPQGKLPEENLAQLDDEQLAELTTARARELDLARASLIRAVGEMDRRGSFATEGHLSMTSWLKDRCRMTARSAKALVSLGRALRTMVKTRLAFESGEITYPATQMLSIAAEAHPETFERDEPMLVEQATRLSPAGLRKALDYWTQAADGDAGVEAAARKRHMRKLFISKTIDGMVRLDGDLDPEGGSYVLAAIRSIAEATVPDPADTRTGPQRRADALVELCAGHLSGTTTDSRQVPQVSLIVDLDTLVTGSGSISELEDGTVVDAETARRIVCDAAVSRVIVRGDSTPLDVGRKTRTVPAGLRRALVVRDRGCTYDGCDRPPQWCDAHHIVPWAHGGATALDNLRLLCRRHHRMVHPEAEGGGPDP